MQRQTYRVGAAAVGACKGINTAAADGQQIYVDDAGGNCSSGASCSNAVVQNHRIAAFFNRKAALDLEEPKQINVEVAGQRQHFTLGTVHTQLQVAGRTGFNRQGRLARTVVNDRIVEFSSLVDRYLQGIGRYLHAVYTHKCSTGSAGLQAGPATADVCSRADHRQPEVYACELQAQSIGSTAIQAGKGGNLGGPYREQGGGASVGSIRQGNAICDGALSQRKVAIKLYKAKQIHRQVAIGFQQRAALAVHVQHQVAGRPRLDQHIEG